MPSKIASKKNGKSGGRPKINSLEKIELQCADKVILTQNQYIKLLDKYGKELVDLSLVILNEWLSKNSENAKKYICKNHYAHFRSDGWLINTAKRQMKLC